MQAVEPPVIVAPAEDQAAGVIEVVGTRADQVQKIDRRTYRVKDNALSAQSDGLQLIRGLPAVIVTPDDQILLLGSPGVTVLIDGRPAQGDAIQTLRTLRGGDIDQIEVITNPSAQYPAAGTGGIINFVLRKKQDDGLSGSADIMVSSKGQSDTGATIKERRGKWTYELKARVDTGTYERSRVHKLTTRINAGAEPTINTEDSRGLDGRTAGSLSGKLTYDLNDRSSLSGEAFAGGANLHSRTSAAFVGLTPDFESFSDSWRRTDRPRFVGFQLSFDHKGKKQGETLKASVAAFGNPRNHERIVGQLDDVAYVRERNEKPFFIFADTTWEHPIGSRSILTTGANWQFEKRRRENSLDVSADDPRLGPDTFDEYRMRQSLTSVYATFQRKFGTWTVMPGLRMEHLDLRITSPGLATVSRERATLFPTFHLEHPLSKTTNMTLSYSKRIQRPGADLLRPYPVVSTLFINVGNPNLRDQITDAYELNLHYRRKNFDAGVIIYERRTKDLWQNDYSLNADGAYLQRIINAGRQIDRGAQFDVTTPLLKAVKGTASINLFYSRTPIDPLISDEDFETFRHTGNATLEWHGKDGKNGRPGDIAQIQLTYESPSKSYQLNYDDSYSLNFSWTHNFSKKLSMTASLSELGSTHYRHQLIALLVREEYEKRAWPEFKLKLVKTLGKAQ